MPHPAVPAAVEGKLATAWTETPIVGVLTPKAKPVGDAAFLLVDYPVTNTEVMTVGAPGANVWRDEGVFRVRLYYPKHQSTIAQQKAGVISALFLGQQFDGVQCWGPSDAPIDDENDRGLFYVQSVVVPYEFDHFG